MCTVVAYQPIHHAGVIDTVQTVYREYGWQWEAHGYHRDLYTIEDYYIGSGGMFWVALDGERVVGCAGVTVHLPESELHRLYLLPEVRGRGLGRRLLDTTMAYARDKGSRRMIAWSDVVLKEAHALYLKNGFVQEGQRLCSDPDKSTEFGFWKEPL
ncbi:MAG TPA: GNAT family N-acetyltransferase [Phycisphaerae bacterium]|nr:GNAT family N-acetyltransferase [Phycisphaerae bacterium]